jgi:hypothetical protein
VVVGDSPYASAEIGGFLGVDVVGVIADDPNGAAYVAGHATSQRNATRSRLAKSAAKVATSVVARLTMPVVEELIEATSEESVPA